MTMFTLTKDAKTVSANIVALGGHAAQYKTMFNEILLSAIGLCNSKDRNATPLIELQKTILANNPRDITVFMKAVSAFSIAAFKQAKNDDGKFVNVKSTQGRYEYVEITGVMAENKDNADKVALIRGKFDEFVENGIVAFKNPAWVKGQANEGISQWDKVQFKSVFDFADYKKAPKGGETKKSAGEVVKALAKTAEKNSVSTVDLLDSIIRNQYMDEIFAGRRLKEADYDSLINLLTEFKAKAPKA